MNRTCADKWGLLVWAQDDGEESFEIGRISLRNDRRGMLGVFRPDEPLTGLPRNAAFSVIHADGELSVKVLKSLRLRVDFLVPFNTGPLIALN